MGQTPLIGMIKQIIQQKLAALHRALNAVPTPFQMQHQGQSSTRQATFILHQTSRHHHHQDNANAIGRARGQGLNQATNGRGHQIHWIGGRSRGYRG
jgi:hypothetical protein